MKVLVFVKATPNSEKGIPAPDEQLQKMFNDMGKFNEKLVKAGVMQEADGLKPSSFGKRLKFSDDNVTVVDGPFAETKELVAGYWIWTVKSMEEAVEWARQCPNPMPGEEGVLELRPTYSMEDFDELATPEIRERNDRLARQIEKRKKGKSPARPKLKAKAKSRSKSKPAPARKKAKPSRPRSRK